MSEFVFRIDWRFVLNSRMEKAPGGQGQWGEIAAHACQATCFFAHRMPRNELLVATTSIIARLES